MTPIRKVVINGFGDVNHLVIEEGQLRDPLSFQVQLAVDYSITSGSDANMLRGTYPFQRKPPFTPGYSVLGRVAARGSAAQRFQPGDTVVCLSKYDGQATRINLPERYLVPVPAGVDPKAAVTLVLDWLTAYQLLYRAAKMKPGQRIFVHGLSGGVGNALLRLAVLGGVEVYGTAAPDKHEELRASGTTAAFDYGNKDWIAAMQRQGGVDAAFDPLGYRSFDESYSILRRGGILVGYGMNLPALTKTPRTSSLPVMLKLFARNLAVWRGKRATFFGLSRRSRFYKPDLEHLLRLLAERRIEVPVKAVFPLEQIQDAQRAYSQNKSIGSIVIDVQY